MITVNKYNSDINAFKTRFKGNIPEIIESSETTILLLDHPLAREEFLKANKDLIPNDKGELSLIIKPWIKLIETITDKGPVEKTRKAGNFPEILAENRENNAPALDVMV